MKPAVILAFGHSDKLHVTERDTRDSPDSIRYDVTMEDPQVFMLRFEKLLQTDPTLQNTPTR